MKAILVEDLVNWLNKVEENHTARNQSIVVDVIRSYVTHEYNQFDVDDMIEEEIEERVVLP